MGVIGSIRSTARTEERPGETGETSEPPTRAPDRHPCAFCGTIYDPADVDCPDCGAELVRRGWR